MRDGCFQGDRRDFLASQRDHMTGLVVKAKLRRMNTEACA
jgi:hypothetical protein